MCVGDGGEQLATRSTARHWLLLDNAVTANQMGGAHVA